MLQQAIEENDAAELQRIEQGDGKNSRKKVDAKSAEEYDKKNGTEFVRFAKFLDNGKVLPEGENTFFIIGKTGDILNKYGLYGNISVKTSTVNSGRHTIKKIEAGSDDWFNIINDINTPLAITKHGQKHRVYLNTEVDGKKVCLVVETVYTGKGDIEVSNIRTFFPRSISKILANEKESLIYPSEEKLKQAIDSLEHNAEASGLSPTSAGKVSNNSSTMQEDGKNSRKGADLYRDKEEYKEGEVLDIKTGFDGYTTKGMTMPYNHPERLLEAWRNKHPNYYAFLTDDKKGIEVYPVEGGKTRLEALYGKARSSKQRQQYVERKAKMMQDRALETGNGLGVKVNVIEPGTETDADRLKSKGWYDTKTGEILSRIVPSADLRLV